MIYFSASREHKLLVMLRRRQVPQSRPLPGLVCLVRVFSYLCCRLAAGQIGNYIYSNDHNGWDSLSAWHCWWYGWVVCLGSSPHASLQFLLCVSSISSVKQIFLICLVFIRWQIAFVLFKCKCHAPQVLPLINWSETITLQLSWNLQEVRKSRNTFFVNMVLSAAFVFHCRCCQNLCISVWQHSPPQCY